MGFREFEELFKFEPRYRLYVGVERERFIVDELGNPLPMSKQVMETLPLSDSFGYELSACQLEDRVGPLKIGSLEGALRLNDEYIEEAVRSLGLHQRFMEVAPDHMDLTVFQDPTGRYQRITKNMPREVLLAACRVAGTHVHIGMPDITTALKVYNAVVGYWELLCGVIDHSGGERLAIYKKMAKDYEPLRYSSLDAFYQYACLSGFDSDPRKNWQLIRVTIHGTIEFRMAGATVNVSEVVEFAQICFDLCSKHID